jgi:hypothetical protein
MRRTHVTKSYLHESMLEILRDFHPSENYTDSFEVTQDQGTAADDPPFIDLAEDAQEETESVMDNLVSKRLAETPLAWQPRSMKSVSVARESAVPSQLVHMGQH